MEDPEFEHETREKCNYCDGSPLYEMWVSRRGEMFSCRRHAEKAAGEFNKKYPGRPIHVRDLKWKRPRQDQEYGPSPRF